MDTLLLISLIVVDVGILAAVIWLAQRKQPLDPSLLMELTEEREYLSELRKSVQEEIESLHAKIKEAVGRMNQIAADAELELSHARESLTKELENIVKEMAPKFEQPLEKLTREKMSVETALKKLESQRRLLNKAIHRAEEIIRFFDKNIPYEEVVGEIQDKKYQDARQMLAQGYQPEIVAQEVGLSTAEVRLIAGIA